MIAPQLVLWTHALSALLFGGLAVVAWRARESEPRQVLAAALAMTALWALAVAGIGGAEIVTRVIETLRNLAWLGFMIALHHRGNVRPPLAVGTVYGVVALVAIGSLALHIVSSATWGQAALQIDNVALLLRMLVAVASLVLVRALHVSVGTPARGGLLWIVAALAGIWCADFAIFSSTYLTGRWESWQLAARGLAMVAAALVIGTGLKRRDDWNVQVSRAVAYQSLSLVAIGAYLALLALATWAIAAVGGANARVLQTAFVFGSTAAILTLFSNSWLRAWTKVKLAKHFFRHRYDYRGEWMRFTETLGAPAGGAALEERIVKAIADLTDSPGGVLLVSDGGGLGPSASWNWDRAALPVASDHVLAAHLHETGRILDLDALRGGRTEDVHAVPQWMLDAPEAWVLVPLPHLGTLAGAILLARPPVSRPLDWEDFDLLKVAGRQVASYLAEAGAHQALAEAQRFDEFNRRFAFILHDIKNLVSQLTLTARNAERHADKAESLSVAIMSARNSALSA
ncbi:MAG: PEP-CTERM system histidine kinase PrsK [Sphingomonadales bacterium]|nr:MAG: PEP-CTERM system histidine kinase PrsK [Sphingomonadales bacterium]